jgi:uncharacterized protein affecting Mg2+/Co2+ transport
MLTVGLGSLALRVPTPTMRLGVAPQPLSATMPGCGGAAPFAPFQGSGSVGDQSQYAPGGQWTQYAEGVVVPAGAARMHGLPVNEVPSNVDGSTAKVTDQAPQVSPALAQGQDMHGCGGASPFASFAGGGSGIGASAKWAPGGQWTTRTSQTSVLSAVERMELSAVENVAAEIAANPNAAQMTEEECIAEYGHLSPALARGQDMHGCGGAAPFTSFQGSGSVGDQSQYAPGGQWTTRH